MTSRGRRSRAARTCYLSLLAAQDTHPLRYLRINATLMHFDEFINFYGIQPGDGMYMAPEERIAVW